MPLQIFFFYQISLYSIFVNIIAIPLAGVLIPIAGILGCIYEPLGIFFVGTSDMILNIYDIICNFFLSLPFSVVIVGHIDMMIMIFMYVIIFISSLYFYAHVQLKFKKYYVRRLKAVTKQTVSAAEYREFLNEYIIIKNNKILIPAALLIALFTSIEYGLIYQYKTRVSMLDIGQGDNAIITTESGKHIMFDCGSSSSKNVYSSITEKYLLYNRIDTLDAIFVSHSDMDHINGVIEMLEGMYNHKTFIKVKSLIMPDIPDSCKDENYNQLVELTHKNNIKITYVSKGNTFNGANYKIDVLWPLENSNKAYAADRNIDDANYLSTVCNVKLKSGSDVLSIMMTGDATIETENNIIKYSESTDVLKVGHHGSKYSSGEKYLKKIHPMYSII